MALKARLIIVLKANDVVVAESEDPAIWQAAFDAIQTGDVETAFPNRATEGNQDEIQWVPNEERAAIQAFADELGVEVADVLGACHPRAIAPYIFINRLHWEAFKRQTPERGRNAVSNAVLAMTLLLLWVEKLNIDRVTLREGMAVLRAIQARDEHASRALENCPWLQRTSGRVVINPERFSQAIAVARAFCLKLPPEPPVEAVAEAEAAD